MSHPLTRLLFDQMRLRHVSVSVMARRSGVSGATLYAWRDSRRAPTVSNIEACLNVLGFRLTTASLVKSSPNRVAFVEIERGAGRAG